jgi:PAS domain S-box-containing protein
MEPPHEMALSTQQAAIDRYERLYECAPFGYLCLDVLGHVLDLNPAAAAMLGQDRSHITGTPLVRYLTDESRNKFYMHLRACRRRAEGACNVRLKSEGRAGYREVALISARDARGSDRYLCHVVMIDSSQLVHSAFLVSSDADEPGKDKLARAFRFLEGQQYELEAQYQRLLATQRLLQQSRDRYAELYDFSPIGYVSMDEAGCLRAINLAAAVILGDERARLAGISLGDFVHEADRARFHAHLQDCRSGSPQVRTELTLKTPLGRRDIELTSVKPADDESADVLYRSAMVDITERKRAEEALRESEAKLRWLIDNMPAVLWIQDEHGSPRYVSANVTRVLGYAEHEVRSGGAHFWFANIHPEDRERVRSAYAMMFSAAESASGAANYDIEYRRQAKDGSWLWVVDRGMSVTQENGVRYATGVFWDTTRRKRMQEQLRESEERFRLLAENINDVFFLTDVDGSRIFYVSPTFEKIWGFSIDRLYRDPASWLELIHEADRKRVRRTIRARRPDAPYDIEFRLRRPDGAVRWIRLRGFPIRENSGRVHRVAGIAADVTARKQTAESLQRSHQQMRSLAIHLQSAREEERKNIAREVHDELGALLLAVKMDAEACRKGVEGADSGLSETMRQLTDRIDAAIESVRRIATDLRPSILDNLGVLAAVEWEAQDVERRTGIECIVETNPEKEDLDVEPEPATAIFRIVQEALSNVVRHSGATRVKIALREEGGTVKLQITDNGRGIDFDGRPESRRWGLVGMAERVSAFNGQFGIDTVKPHGTVITATIPARSKTTRELRRGM